MSHSRLAWPLLLALSACAQLPLTSAAPVCDGHHRRPANPHGTVLSPIPPPAPAEPPGGFASCP